MDIPTLFALPKVIVAPPVWRRRAPRHLTLVTPLDVGGITTEGLIFRIQGLLAIPNRSITFQLEAEGLRAKTAALSRLEWKPIKPHNNKGLGPVEWRFRDQPGTHLHGFMMNWSENERFVKKLNLPIALPVAAEPKSFADALALAGEEFRISGLELIEPPQWEPDLLLGWSNAPDA